MTGDGKVIQIRVLYYMAKLFSQCKPQDLQAS